MDCSNKEMKIYRKIFPIIAILVFISTSPVSSGVSGSSAPDDTIPNLIRNGKFEHGKANWDLWVSDSAKAVFEVKEEKASITIKSPGEKPWSVILNQGNLFIEKDKTYRINFAAESDSHCE